MYVNSLAGYSAGKNGETFAFVIVVNNETRKGVVGAIDKAALVLVGEKETEEEKKSNENKTANNANGNQQNDFYSRSIANQ